MTDTSGTPDDLVPDPVPDADRAEQEQLAVRPDIETVPFRIPADVPEADAIEQALPGPLPDEDDAPR
ncbi:MAG TPA: hypothetical protein VHM89_00800 [Acidimicrobiales bacterium]|nr:hypothetical protein [Acidimicrobiales bacterium]